MTQKDRAAVRGFYRLQLVDPDGTVASDSGWHENQITNEGFRNYLCRLLGAVASSSQISYMAIGSGTAPGATATTLQGEVASRAAVTAATSSTSKTIRFTATFNSSDSFLAGTSNISNIALAANQYSSDTHTIFCGNSYASSSCATNQSVNATYDITFA